MTKSPKETLYYIDPELFFEEGYTLKVRQSETLIFIYAHCLDSFEELIKFLIDSNGFLARNIFILPKSYSAIDDVVHRLSKSGVNILDYKFEFEVGKFDKAASRNIRDACQQVKSAWDSKNRFSNRASRLVLVDDGGLLTRTWYEEYGDPKDHQVVSIQQTASGTYEAPQRSRIPKINVARSAAKRWFESKIIATGVARKVLTLDVLGKGLHLGVAGYGAVGRALAKELTNNGERVLLHDIEGLPAVKGQFFGIYREQKPFLADCDVVFGCVGRDWILQENINAAEGEKKYISCSSRDVEFRSLLLSNKWNEDDEPFSDLVFFSSGKKTVYNSGFPINFDRCKEYEHFEEIVLTRALILGAIIQAICMSYGETYTRPIKLAVNVQKKLIETWLRERGKDMKPSDYGVSKADFESLNWWIKESSGDRYHAIRD